MMFVGEQGNVIAFFIVHHLARKHGFTRKQALEYDQGLREAVMEYIGFPSEAYGYRT
jgi:hypothetical protein